MKRPLFFIKILMLDLLLAGCSWHSEVKCIKNCSVDSVLKYEKSSYIFELNQAAMANSPLWKLDDPIDSCTIRPSLPTGLILQQDCAIEGVPKSSAPMQIYTVTATARNYTVVAKLSLATSVDGVVPEEHGNYNFVVNSVVNEKLSKSSSVPKNCRIQPKLVLGLTLSDACQLTGTPITSSLLKSYTVSSTVDNLEKEEIYKITVVGNDDPNLLLMVDARRANGSNPVSTVSTTYSALKQNITDLSVQKRETIFELNLLTSVMGAGNGTPEDPYRFLNTSGTLRITNPPDLKFTDTSGTMITFFKYREYSISPTAAIYLYLSNFWGFQSSFQSSSISPFYFGFNGWHQLGYVIDRTNNKTFTYMDGELKNTSNDLPQNSNQISDLTLNAEFAHLAIFRKAFSAIEILNYCRSFQGVYFQLPCASESRALQFDLITTFYPMVNDCSPVNWKLYNTTGSLTASPVDLKFEISGPNAQFFVDSMCVRSASSYTVPAGSTTGTLYFKPSNSGQFSQTAQPQKASMAPSQTIQTYYGLPTTLKYGGDPGCAGETAFIWIGAFDNNDKNTYVKSPVTINIFDGTTSTPVVLDSTTPYGKYYPVTPNKTYTMSVIGGAFNGGTVTLGAQSSCGD